MAQERRLVPTGAARAAVEGHRRAGASPAYPEARLLEAAETHWEDGAELMHLAWELARNAPEASAAEARALVLLGFAALVSVRTGSSRMPVGPAARFLESVLVPLKASDEDIAAVAGLVRAPPASVAPVLGPASAGRRPLLLEGGWLYVQRLHAAEEALVRALDARLRAPAAADAGALAAALEDVVRRAPVVRGRRMELSEEQRRAVALAASRGLGVVTGGPGTGKTSVVVSLLRTLVRTGVRPECIALAAPTGKAAQRMDESVRAALEAVPEPDAADRALLAARPPARTLHRLLGFSPGSGRFHHHAQNPLSEDVVVVDEGSMVDLFLMERLVVSVRPGARLVLLGDADQLPSVDAGAVFRDLVPPDGAGADDVRAGSAVRLRKSFRMDPADPAGRAILTVANRVQAGAEDVLGEAGSAEVRVPVLARAEAVRFSAVELLEAEPGSPAARALVERWARETLDADGELAALARHEYRFGPEGAGGADVERLERLFGRYERARLLCLTRSDGSPWGAGALNALLHARAWDAQRTGGLRVAPELLPGEPVLVESNDYERELFNGDGGVVVRGVLAADGAGGDGRQHFLAAFRRGPGRFVAFPLDALRGRLSLAYAMTVHKSQGSEFDRVGLVLPSDRPPLLTRELLYTALTRARKSVVVLAKDREDFRYGVGRSLQRFSGVAERLAGAGKVAAAR